MMLSAPFFALSALGGLTLTKLSGNDFTFRSSKGTAALLDESVA